MKVIRSASWILVLRIWSHLSQRRKWQVVFLVFVMLVSAVAEIFSLSAVLPFLTVLGDPEQAWKLSVLRNLSLRLGILHASQLLMPTTIIFCSAVVIAAAIRLANLWLNGRVAAAIGTDLSCEAYRRTLFQPYIVHVRRNSSDVISATTTQISNTVTGLNLVLQLLTSSLVALGLLATLFVMDFKVALLALAFFGSSYALLMFATHRRLGRISAVMSLSSKQQIKALQEGLGAVRDVIMSASQSAYLEIYREADIALRSKQAQSAFLGSFPRYALEAIGLLLLAGLGLMLSFQLDNKSAIIPTLGAFALGAQRLLPALQQIYSSWALFRAYSSSIEAVLGLLDQPMIAATYKHHHLDYRFEAKISLNNVFFRYDSGGEPVLSGINDEIPKGERIGIIGPTGSGKSTLVDLIMGLLAPSSGEILVDGIDLHSKSNPGILAWWRSVIAHVPQNIYLSDASIAQNIAFGVPEGKIDMSRVVAAASQARLSAFINSSEYGYDTFVGERGIRLSGGQRQRIGIARALYRQAQVLVFDEATSALDSETEASVMSAIECLSKDLTVITIAHRTSTLIACDRIISIEGGAIARQGSPSRVLGV